MMKLWCVNYIGNSIIYFSSDQNVENQGDKSRIQIVSNKVLSGTILRQLYFF